jgi:hypothetical protein
MPKTWKGQITEELNLKKCNLIELYRQNCVKIKADITVKNYLQRSKKTLISTVLQLLYDFLFFKTDVNVP